MKELVNAFAGNPLLTINRSHVNHEELANLLKDEAVEGKGGVRLLPVYDGKVLIRSNKVASVSWSLAWQTMRDFGENLPKVLSSASDISDKSIQGTEEDKRFDQVVYLGERDGIPSFAIDVSSSEKEDGSSDAERVAALFSTPVGNESKLSFVDLRTLMMGSDWERKDVMEELSIAGHSRAITSWHKLTQYCGRCGTKTMSMEAGGRRQCLNPTCKLKTYPRLDPVVIMLVIDRERDRVLLARSARFPGSMWSCLAGFLESGESLEEAVRRETFEEVGLRIGEVTYHSSQPWPVGGPSLPSQLMVGFFAYAKTFDIQLDRLELDNAQWYSREQIRQVLDGFNYRATLEATNHKMWRQASGQEKSSETPRSLVPVGESPMYVPGPYAIAHHLIATWAKQTPEIMLSRV